MLTLFTTAKGMKGIFAVIQANALESWTRLLPRPEIIVIGEEEGLGALCGRLGLKYVPEVQRNEKGTPLISDLFQKGQRLASNGLICYCNADIVLMQDFMDAARIMSAVRRPFLLTGCRWDLDLSRAIDFSDERWAPKLCEMAKTEAHLALRGVDYFMFPRGFYAEVPPFAIGRFYFDTWLLAHPKRTGAWLVDATTSVFAIHQNHDYSHSVPAGVDISNTAESKANLALYDMPNFDANLNLIASHVISRGRLKSALPRIARTRLERYVRYELGKVRHALGLRRKGNQNAVSSPRSKRSA